jgi:hypothetical protein
MYFKNPLSTVGIFVAAVSGLLHLSLLFLDFSRGLHNPYLNIWFHIVLPPFVVMGFILALYGGWRHKRIIKKRGVPAPKPRRANPYRLVFILGTVCVVLIPFLGFTTYTGYKYTDSVEFCGRACHVPMKPMYTAYQYSAHARVPCSSCHIGEGASWFVRSKLSGTKQVFATAFDTFPRPIPTPIKNLRPARETCERCHWPEKAFGKRVVERPHFASDEQNTYRPLRMILNTGGGDPRMGPIRGIHWHYLASNKTEYIAIDAKRLEIPWIRVTQEGETRVYRSDGLPADAPPPPGEIRTMDCLDCHNRPSHKYRTPDETLNPLFAINQLDASFPYLKREAARLMATPYEDTPSAGKAIEEGLIAFYEENYPEIAEKKRGKIKTMAEVVFQAYQRNIFPEMNTDWRTTPDHIGHKYYPGCFRCHDNHHLSGDGQGVPNKCELCHEFLESKAIEGSQALVHGEYNHPFPLEGAHENAHCYACHVGGPTPPPTCEGCHHDVRDFMAGRLPALSEVSGKPHPHSGELECIDCHEESRRFTENETLPLCVECHDEEHAESARKKMEELKALRKRITDMIRTRSGGAAAGWTRDASSVLKQIQDVGSVHNLDYAIEALKALENGHK